MSSLLLEKQKMQGSQNSLKYNILCVHCDVFILAFGPHGVAVMCQASREGLRVWSREKNMDPACHGAFALAKETSQTK